MRTLKIQEKLCHSSRKNGLLAILFGFGCAVGASIFFLTAIIFMFPWMSPSLMNPMLLNLKFSFPNWQLSPSSTITTDNTTIATATASTPFSSARNFSGTGNNETASYQMENNLKNSSVVFVDLPTVRELVVAKDSIITPLTSNYSSDSNSVSVETVQTNGSDSDGSCDIFDGEWVRDNDKQPYYSPGSCPFVEGQNSACYNNGRPDDQFLRWQWQSQQTDARCNSNNFP
ncbi:hypothetical protein MKX01_025752, partial [Papaver californicum]